MSAVSSITLTLLFFSFVLFFLGLLIVHGELEYYFRIYSYGNGHKFINSELIKGFFEVGIAVIILISVKFFLGSTIDQRQWWLKFKALKERDCSWNVERLHMQSNVTQLLALYYGTVIFSAVIIIIFGIIYLNYTDTGMIGVAFIDVLVGALIMYVGFWCYQRDIGRLSDKIFPMLEPIKMRTLKDADGVVAED